MHLCFRPWLLTTVEANLGVIAVNVADFIAGKIETDSDDHANAERDEVRYPHHHLGHADIAST